MQTLEVTQSNALTAFSKADAKGKELLKNLFGEKVFSQKITDRVKTFEDACEIVGIDASERFAAAIWRTLQEDAKPLFAMYKLIIIARALNEEWIPDWNDSDQYKWYPWFKIQAGFGFSDAVYGCTDANAVVGSRLCFKSEELAEYAGKQFEDIYKDFLTL